MSMNRDAAAELTAAAFHVADQVGPLIVARLAVGAVGARSATEGNATMFDIVRSEIAEAEGCIQRASSLLLSMVNDETGVDLGQDLPEDQAESGRHAMLTDLDVVSPEPPTLLWTEQGPAAETPDLMGPPPTTDLDPGKPA